MHQHVYVVLDEGRDGSVPSLLLELGPRTWFEKLTREVVIAFPLGGTEERELNQSCEEVKVGISGVSLCGEAGEDEGAQWLTSQDLVLL
jgi:hypothetical protein